MADQKCILAWARDVNVTGSHNLVAIRCNDYIASLEGAIIDLTGDEVLVNAVRERIGLNVIGPEEQ